jgi:tRNA (guanine-N7-)-methyltransferase
MRLPTVFAAGGRELALGDLALPLDLDDLVPGGGRSGAPESGSPWEVEIGIGKGRYLLGRAGADPGRRFLGVEVASKYYRLARRRARHRGLENLLLVRGEGLFLLSSVLPRRFASALHVYHPDPWPKSRHARRRLFDPETVDLVLGVLAPGGELFFATDFIAYGERVEEILRGFPGLAVERREAWPEGPRTNYEAKYVREGRPILRLHGRLDPDAVGGELHPRGARGILAATARRAAV